MTGHPPPNPVSSPTPSPARPSSATPEGGAALPPSPITGRPAKRRVQHISKSLLRALWGRGLGIDIGRLLESVPSLGLYEADDGLLFFHPAITGDSEFYAAFYAKVGAHEHLNRHVLERAEYRHAARHIAPNAAVLDIGCGFGAFRVHLPQAHYLGLDPFAPAEADSAVLREDLWAHAQRQPEAYDVVTAFQVIEHVADPRAFAEAMVRMLKPGGMLILCAPLYPSLISRLPNFLLNAPPHHVTCWNRSSFTALAEVFRLDIVELTDLAPSPHEGLIHWMQSLCPVKAGAGPDGLYFAHRWSWHLSLALSYAVARTAHRIKVLPPGARAAHVFMAARKPHRASC